MKNQLLAYILSNFIIRENYIIEHEKASKSELELKIAREQANHCIPIKEDNSQ